MIDHHVSISSLLDRAHLIPRSDCYDENPDDYLPPIHRDMKHSPY